VLDRICMALPDHTATVSMLLVIMVEGCLQCTFRRKMRHLQQAPPTPSRTLISFRLFSLNGPFRPRGRFDAMPEWKKFQDESRLLIE
jgi:hypothetical protein